MGLVGTLCVLCMISSICLGLSIAQTIFDVTKFGAIGNGAADDSQAFSKAWTATCGAQGTATMVVPGGKTFLLKSIAFVGPCKPKAIHFQVFGTLLAPKTLTSCFSICWLSFENVNGLTLDGSGRMDGQGAAWWNKGVTSGSCGSRPTVLMFNGCNSLQLAGLSLINSPGAHISILNCVNVIVSKITITAPNLSPNTDGIDIMRSSHIQIKDSVIGTGDDCIALNEATSSIKISNVDCGPGHGISVGSLGKGGYFQSSEDVEVRNCSFTGTQNGPRIKTYSGGKGYVRKITFDGIILKGVDSPIVIDQNYCNGKHNCPRASTGLQVSDVTFRNIRGSSSGLVGIKLDCNNGNGCKNVIMENINILSATSGKPPSVETNHVQGRATNTIPAVVMNN